MYKTMTTDNNDTKHKVKYSPNRGDCYWREGTRKGTRENDKRELKKMLEKEYGIKHTHT
jgi:hypothetical protein